MVTNRSGKGGKRQVHVGMLYLQKIEEFSLSQASEKSSTGFFKRSAITSSTIFNINPEDAVGLKIKVLLEVHYRKAPEEELEHQAALENHSMVVCSTADHQPFRHAIP